MKSIFITIAGIFYLSGVFAQATTSRKNQLTGVVLEKFQVLKSDNAVKQGLYQALYQARIAVASGEYNGNKKTGLWHFYDQKGNLVQNYDFTNNRLLYEAPEDSTSDIRYFVDQELTGNDRSTNL